jgi:bacteriocin-like protein
MSKHENKLAQLDENDLKKVIGGGKASPKETGPKETVSLNYGRIEWTYATQ